MPLLGHELSVLIGGLCRQAFDAQIKKFMKSQEAEKKEIPSNG